MVTLKTLESNSFQNTNDPQLLNLMAIAGLSHPQARVYLELVKMKKSTASGLCKTTGINDSRIYSILSELEQIGLIVVQTSIPKLYMVLPLEEGLHNLRERLNRDFTKKTTAIKDLKVLLTPLFDTVVSIPTAIAFIIKGRNNIINKIHHELPKAEKEVIIRLPTVNLYLEFEPILIELQKKGIKINVGVSQKEITDSKQTHLKVCKTTCECFYLTIDRDYLLSVSNWNSKNIYSIWTSDMSLINITSAYFSNSNDNERTRN
jgi:sugar-specific transcriptional regulator TrmB